MPAFRDVDLNTKAHSTSMPTFLAFRLTVFLWSHSTPWEIRAIHVKVISVSLKQSASPPSHITSHRPHLGVSPGVEWTHRLDLIWVSFLVKRRLPPLPPFSRCYWSSSLFTLCLRALTGFGAVLGALFRRLQVMFMLQVFRPHALSDSIWMNPTVLSRPCPHLNTAPHSPI